jgi:hypothetical protein
MKILKHLSHLIIIIALFDPAKIAAKSQECGTILGFWKEVKNPTDEVRDIQNLMDHFGQGKYVLKIVHGQKKFAVYFDTGINLYDYRFEQCSKSNLAFVFKNNPSQKSKIDSLTVVITSQSPLKICMDFPKKRSRGSCFVRFSAKEMESLTFDDPEETLPP